MKSKKIIVKSAAIVSLGIMTSRILGFVRDVFMAYFFGTKIVAQAFVMAFTIPNMLRQLVGEGAVNTVLVPVLTEYREKKEKAEFFRFANVLFNLFFVILLVITAFGILIAPVLIRILAPGFITDPIKLSLTIELSRILFPYVLVIGLVAYCTGVLNTFGHFAAPAYASTLLNAVVVVTMLIFFRSFEINHLVLAILIGGVVEILFLMFPLLRKGPFFNFKEGLFHEGAKKVGRLLVPRLAGAGMYQVNILVDRILASLEFIVGKGAVAAMYYGNRLFQLPLSLFGVALATAALPTLSSLAAKRDMEKLKESISFSIRNMFFLSAPASIGLMVLAKPIIKVIYERGEFTAAATAMTSSVLFFYSMGVVAYGGVMILVSAFYAMQDTLTPVKTAFVALLLNIALNLIFMVPLKAGGLALATSIVGYVNFVFLFNIIQRRIGLFDKKELSNSFFKITASSVIMGIAAYILSAVTNWGCGIRDALSLILIIIASIGAYLLASFVLKVEEMRMILSWIKRT